MIDCWFCGLKNSDDTMLSHAECEAEYRDRLKHCKCVKCGGLSLNDSIYCSSCGPDSGFGGYPDMAA